MSFDPLDPNSWPEEIVIGRHLVKIVLTPRLAQEHGYWDPRAKEIVIAHDSAEEMLYTLVHEFIECINDLYSIHLDHESIERLEEGLGGLLIELLSEEEDA